MDDFKVEFAHLKFQMTSSVMTIQGLIYCKCYSVTVTDNEVYIRNDLYHALEIKMESNDVILADLEMENAALHDVEILQRFIGRRYQRLQNLKILRMTQPEKKFTGR